MLLVSAISLLAAGSSLGAARQIEQPIAYVKYKFGPNYFHMIQADVASGRVAAQTVHTKGLTSVWKMIGRKQPAAAITGTFFSPRFKVPVADVLIEGKLVAKGSRGTAIGVGYDGGVSIFDRPFMANVDWSEYEYGLRGAVRVIKDGHIQPNPKAQKFKDKRIWGRAARTGVGLSKNGKLQLFATTAKVTLSEFGKAMKYRGAQDAVSLDGGGSTCMYYMGNLLIPPNRYLSNMFVLTPTESF